ncbi:MAG: PAS domain-containing sensor histidine kinase [Elusimicrobia bacterium]|nr:PAS domain-containing sensor histidine kinase [Elusimicrobiota bacterium]
MALLTRFLPAERAAPAEVRRQAQRLSEVPLLCTLLDGIPDHVFVLNARRQIVFANRSARERLSTERDGLLGARPGEALGCANAVREMGGCGTSEFCTACGIGLAMLRVERGLPAEEDARIPGVPGREDAEVQAVVTPFSVGSERFVLLALRDRSEESRRLALERVFFHDLLNTAGGLLHLADLFPIAPDADLPELSSVLSRLSQRLVDEIVAQRDLAAVERGEYHAEAEAVDARAALESAAEVYRHHRAGRDRSIKVSDGPTAALSLDPRLLGRVLGNLLKNALEAERPGAEVRLGCRLEPGRVCLWVANASAMPRPVQLQVFQRSFSTKGPGRGLGTYGAKLITERYLGGELEFDSGPQGTEFRVLLPR